MNKITFEEWKKDYEDILYIKQNYKKIHEHYRIPKECINGGDDYLWLNTKGDVNQNTTIGVRIFKHGGFYEMTLSSKYYLLLGSQDWLVDTTDIIDKELYEWHHGEIEWVKI